MAKEKTKNQEEKDTILTCTKCGKYGEVVIGDKGKELCSACLNQINTPTEKEKKPFVKIEKEVK